MGTAPPLSRRVSLATLRKNKARYHVPTVTLGVPGQTLTKNNLQPLPVRAAIDTPAGAKRIGRRLNVHDGLRQHAKDVLRVGGLGLGDAGLQGGLGLRQRDVGVREVREGLGPDGLFELDGGAKVCIVAAQAGVVLKD